MLYLHVFQFENKNGCEILKHIHTYEGSAKVVYRLYYSLCRFSLNAGVTAYLTDKSDYVLEKFSNPPHCVKEGCQNAKN